MYVGIRGHLPVNCKISQGEQQNDSINLLDLMVVGSPNRLLWRMVAAYESVCWGVPLAEGESWLENDVSSF